MRLTNFENFREKAKIWQLHTVNLIGLIFGYSAALIVFHVPIKFQLPTSFTFSVIEERENPLLIARKSHFLPLLTNKISAPYQR